MRKLDSLVNFVEQEKNFKPHKNEVEVKLSLSERQQFLKDNHKNLMLQKSMLDRVARSKSNFNSSYDKQVDTIYINKAQKISSDLIKIKGDAKRLGTILEANPKNIKGPSNG